LAVGMMRTSKSTPIMSARSPLPTSDIGAKRSIAMFSADAEARLQRSMSFDAGQWATFFRR
jgi:hypothetical protein